MGKFGGTDLNLQNLKSVIRFSLSQRIVAQTFEVGKFKLRGRKKKAVNLIVNESVANVTRFALTYRILCQGEGDESLQTFIAKCLLIKRESFMNRKNLN